MAIVIGTLNARLHYNGTVEMCFTTSEGNVLRPLLAKNLDTAEQDFIRTDGMEPSEAAAFRTRTEMCDFASSIPRLS